MRRHTYRPFDRCVFCLRECPPEERTDEHIIPEALHGSLVLEKGACRTCARETNARYENEALNKDMQLPRVLLQLRGKRGTAATELRHLPPVLRGNGVEGEDLERLLGFPIDLYPRVFFLALPPPAGLLCGIDRGSTMQGVRLQEFSLGGPQISDVTVRMPCTVGPFATMIAKIAYCYAVAEKGFDAFDGGPIRDLLAGRRDDVFNFVGAPDSKERLTNRHLHGLYFRERDGWLTVLVHLFASLAPSDAGAIPYEVVVGKALK